MENKSSSQSFYITDLNNIKLVGYVVSPKGHVEQWNPSPLCLKIRRAVFCLFTLEQVRLG